MLYSHFLGSGSYLPKKIITNAELAKTVDTSDEWIYSRTGIRSRHIASKEESTSSLAIEASRRAIEASKIEAKDIDLIILATATPDKTFPATASIVQRELGITKGAVFDISAACSGFVYAVNIMDSMLKTGQAQRALLIGSETLSRITDWEDRSSCVLFGDGAGAMIFEARAIKEQKNQGLLPGILHSDGKYFDMLCSTGGASTSKDCGTITMNGREVYRHAVNNMSSVIEELLIKNNLRKEDIDWYIPHQANLRIIESISEKLNLPLDRFIMTIEDTANVSAGSIPIAFDKGIKDGRIKQNDLILIAAMGGGFTWGASIFRV